jgi:putative oxidoreductase
MKLRRLLPSREWWLAAFVLVVRLGLGFMFIASSVPKIRQPFMFLGSVYGYELVRPKLGVQVAMALPWLELLVGVCLVGGVFVGGALLASTGMGVLFTFVLASALWRHLDISCGCFTTSLAGKISYATLIRAVVITLVSAAAYAATILLQPKEWQAAPGDPEPRQERQSSQIRADPRLLPAQE